MIRAESFAATTEDFASARKRILASADDELRPHIKDALTRIGLPSWQSAAVDAAVDIFDKTARSEVDEWNQILDDMRDAFAHELGEALKKTKRVDAAQADSQLETIVRWVSTMAVNAGTEAATTSDPSGDVGLEWITMSDTQVRHTHQEANGQTVPTGHEFSVGGEKLLYPGQPVGDPSVWINCRCVVRPTMLTEAAGKTITAGGAPGLKKDGTPPVCKYCEAPATQYVLHSEGMAFVPACDDHIDDAKTDAEESVPGGAPDPGNIDKVGAYSIREDSTGDFKPEAPKLEDSADTSSEVEDPQDGDISTTCVIVALPAESDPVTASSSEADGAHCTLLFLGDVSALNRDELATALEQFVTEGEVGVITDKVSGSAVLGKDSADVVLIDGANLAYIRSGLLGQDSLAHAYDAVEQFPNWLPHVTLGYPETPRVNDFAGEAITFDRLALWFGEDRTAIYPLGGTPVSDTAPAPEAVTAAVEDAVPAEAPPAAEAPAPPAEPAAELPTGDNLKPWHGVLAPEGAPSGDQREFVERMLTTRNLPLPLKAMFADAEGHSGSVVVGRIDEVFRDGGLIKAKGVWDDSPEAVKASGMIDKKMWRGVSVDLDAAEGEMVQAAEEGEADAIKFSKGRISSATLCAIPAFAEAFVRNGTWEEFANEPLPTGEMVPIPDWPGAEAPAPSPAFSLVASAAPKISADYFRNPMLEENTPVTLGEDGHIFGHLATWDTCHVGYEVCTTAPTSVMDYAYFLTGQVFTDAGPVAVGQITLGGGHADGSLGVRAAIAHYDNVATAVADINVGEDDHGIWFSGKLRDGLTDKQIHELFAAGPSGDWRGVRAGNNDSMEMIAAHAVNVPGFPVPRPRFAMEGTRQVSLIAAGAVATAKKPELDPEFVAKLDAYHAMKTRQEAVSKLRAKVRADRAASIKSAVLSLKGN